MAERGTRWQLKSRYLFTGQLELKTALHIGGGKAGMGATDQPIVRTPDGAPFIPGSSFKGAFRSTVEKLAAALPGLKVCSLIPDSGDCPSVDKGFSKAAREWSEDELLRELENRQCHTCHLFGSPYAASRITFSDLYVADWDGVIQARDGVAIDRDSEKAADGLLYDYEVVPSTASFSMEIMLENPSDIDLGLACAGLQEFAGGMGFIGGMRSRGLGRCCIKGLQVYRLDLETEEGRFDRLLRYLTKTTPEEKMVVVPDPQEFLEEHITNLLQSALSPRPEGGAPC